MADDSTTTAPAPVTPYDPEAIQRALAALGLNPPAQAPTPTEGGPGTKGVAGFLSDVGTVLGGGPTGLLGLSPDEQAAAGRHDLLNFGINMLAASGKSYAPKDFGTVLAAGLQGAQSAQQESENRAYVGRGAQQQLAQQAYENRLKAIKEALPLLQMQQRASLGNPFAATTPGAGGANTSISAAAAVPAYGGAVNAPPMPAEYEPYFQAASKETGIPVEVLKAQAAQESGFNPNAKGAAGEIGLFQIKPDTATKPGFGLQGVSSPDVLRDPATNIMFGARYLKARAGNADLSTPAGQAAALQAYNGGGDKNYVANVFRYMPPGGGGGGGTQVAATKPPPAAPAAATPPGRVQVATADTGTKTDATPAPAPPPAYATAPTREAATIQAAATKQPVMIQGGDGGTVMPDGSFRSAPPPATTAPPVIVPGQPRDTTGLKDEELSLPEFQQRYRTPLPPEAGTVKVNPQVQADRQAAVGAAQQAVTQAQQGMRAAEQDWTVQRDDKSLQARSAAQQRLETAQQNLQTAQQNANKLTQDAETESVKNRQAAQQAQDQQLAAAYKDARDRANQAADAERNRQAQIALETQKGEEARKTAAAASENSFVLDTRKKLTDERSAAQETVDNLGLLDNLSKAAGAATPLDSLNWGGMPLRQWLLQKNIGSADQIAHWGAQQAYEAAINQTVIGLRKGVSMGALSDRDLSFLQGMSPSVLQRPDTREAVTAYLRSAQLRKIRFADSVDELWDGGKGMSYGQALIAARKQLPDIVPQIPAGASNADKRDWFTKNVPAGTLYRNARGDLTVWPGMPSDQPQVPRD